LLTAGGGGRLIGLTVTDWRQILVPLNRKIEADGELTSILPEEIASEAEGVSGGWWSRPRGSWTRRP
jgi:hypothetical protein